MKLLIDPSRESRDSFVFFFSISHRLNVKLLTRVYVYSIDRRALRSDGYRNPYTRGFLVIYILHSRIPLGKIGPSSIKRETCDILVSFFAIYTARFRYIHIHLRELWGMRCSFYACKTWVVITIAVCTLDLHTCARRVAAIFVFFYTLLLSCYCSSVFFARLRLMIDLLLLTQ